jgi:hypothetical protein
MNITLIRMRRKFWGGDLLEEAGNTSRALKT